MANYSNLRQAINETITQNGVGAITGPILNQVLQAMINALGAGYQFVGVATPTTNPGTYDYNVFYLAWQGGTYTNFGGLQVNRGFNILRYDGTWHVDELVQQDSVLLPNSQNLPTTGTIFEKFKLDGGAYDVSAHNNNMTFADLAALLSSQQLNTLIPTAIRHGGMSIKFIQSDNKYVQFRLMKNQWSTTVSDWQGVDSVATLNSKNLLESSFTYTYKNAASQRNSKIEKVLFKNKVTNYTLSSGCYYIINGVLEYLDSESWKHVILPIGNITRVKTYAGTYGTAGLRRDIPAIIYLKASSPTQSNYINGFNQYSESITHTGPFDSGLTIPRGATHIIINLSFTQLEDIELYNNNFLIDQEAIENSDNPISSGAVYEQNESNNSRFVAIEDALSGMEEKIETIEIITNSSKLIEIRNNIPNILDASDKWGYGIIPVSKVKHVITFAANYNIAPLKAPAILFLRTNEISQSSYISNSERYGTIATENPNINKFDEDIIAPNEAKFIAINLFKDYADSTTTVTTEGLYKSAELDERITTLEQEISSQEKTLVVRKKPASGEYASISAALAVADSNTKILIYSGIYVEHHLNLPKDVILQGIGEVEIRGYLPPSTPVMTSYNNSTLECYYGATLKDLKITAQNMRYPIHADFSNGDAKWIINNCTFEHYGNEEINNYWASQPGGSTSNIMSACSAWGGGTNGGDYVHCKNCKFVSTGRAFSTHNNTGNSYNTKGASHIILEDCEMVSKGIDRDGVLVDLLAPLFIQSLDCPVDNCDVVISNCSINGYIVFQNSGGDGWSNKLKMFNCGKNKLAFSGYGSGPNLIRNGDQISVYQTHYDKYPLISNCCHSFVNRGASAITKGKAVKQSSNGGVALYENTADDVFGVAMQDIPVGEIGDVWFDGYLSRIWLDGIRTTNITEGDNIYVDNTGSFSTSGTKIAFKAVDNQNIKLFN